MVYNLSSYLLACMVCNEYWKISFFPVEDNPRRLRPDQDTPEIPLLLNPFDANHNPTDDLYFNDFRHIGSKSDRKYLYETIRTFSLDRESLRRSRQEKAQRAHGLAIELNQAISATDQQEITKLLWGFYELDREEYAHSGMVRAIFQECCGLTWEE